MGSTDNGSRGAQDLNDIFAGSNQPLAPSGQIPVGDKYQQLGNFYTGSAAVPQNVGYQQDNGFSGGYGGQQN